MTSKSKWARLFNVKSDRRSSHTVRALVVIVAFLLLFVPLIVLRVNAPTAHAAAGSNVLNPGESLWANQTLTSPNGSYTLYMQPNGNLVLVGGNRWMWQSNTANSGGVRVVMQATDGNLVIYTAAGSPVWQSWTGGNPGNPGAWLNVQNDGNLVIYNAATQPLWATNTGCIYPSVTYYGKGNFYNVFSETLNAEVCFGSGNVWTVWTNHKFWGLPGWSDTELGRGVFWDSSRYGGALTIWSNDQDTFGWGPVAYNVDTYLRIWVTPNGQEYQYGGP